LSGEEKGSYCISLSQLLRGPTELDNQTFIQRLREFTSLCVLDSHVKSAIQGIIEQFAFSLTFFNKFEDLWNRIFFNHTGSKLENLRTIKQFAWMIFAYAKMTGL
jgi:hypothetical protein